MQTPTSVVTVTSVPLLNNSLASSQSNNSIASNLNNFSNLTSAHSVSALPTSTISSERLVARHIRRRPIFAPHFCLISFLFVHFQKISCDKLTVRSLFHRSILILVLFWFNFFFLSHFDSEAIWLWSKRKIAKVRFPCRKTKWRHCRATGKPRLLLVEQSRIERHQCHHHDVPIRSRGLFCHFYFILFYLLFSFPPFFWVWFLSSFPFVFIVSIFAYFNFVFLFFIFIRKKNSRHFCLLLFWCVHEYYVQIFGDGLWCLDIPLSFGCFFFLSFSFCRMSDLGIILKRYY